LKNKHKGRENARTRAIKTRVRAASQGGFPLFAIAIGLARPGSLTYRIKIIMF
jgi:hypothetical protein